MIVRGPRPQGNFYILDKAISEDRRLSWGARGLLVYLLGKPDAWQVSPAALMAATASSQRPTGRDGVYALLGELRDAGYLTRRQERAQDGSLGRVIYVVSEQPLPASQEAAPLPAQPDTAQPLPANPSQSRTEEEARTDDSARTERRSARAKIGFNDEIGAFTGITDQQLHLWTQACPGINVATEIVRAACWILANPTRRPKSAYGRFLNGWLHRASGNSPPQPSAQQPAQPTQRSERDRHRSEWANAIMGQGPNTGRSDVIDVAAHEVH